MTPSRAWLQFIARRLQRLQEKKVQGKSYSMRYICICQLSSATDLELYLAGKYETQAFCNQTVMHLP